MSAFIDEALLYAKAGDGGNGAIAWRREAHVAKGGPAGGDGGDGGDVVIVGDDGIGSLLDFKYKPRLVAKSGEGGRGKKQAGHFGPEIVARVPLGTQVFDGDTDELLCDIVEHGQRFIVCRGGSGGFGNARFATPSRQAPEFANPGTEGEEKNLRLELKLMADVGLLGFPNAGKSTFVARVSAARPKIADYPFTTLVPQLGVVRVPGTNKADGQSFVIADIPGVIEGAAEGAGLGLQFLKHLERVRVLLHLVEVPLEVAGGDDSGVDIAPSAVRGPVDLVEQGLDDLLVLGADQQHLLLPTERCAVRAGVAVHPPCNEVNTLAVVIPQRRQTATVAVGELIPPGIVIPDRLLANNSKASTA